MTSARYPADGLKITLSALKGLTVDTKGRALLAFPLVLQCGPLEEFTVTHQFTVGNYDTVEGEQYARRGSLQLRAWQFDTLAVVTANKDGAGKPLPHFLPGWVPFPQQDHSGKPLDPTWFADQIQAVHDSGAPFRFVAGYVGAKRPLLACSANLVQYSESYQMGEDDTIYFKNMSFGEWRDPTASQRGSAKKEATAKPKGTTVLPAWVTFYAKGANKGRALTQHGQWIPKKGQATLAQLATAFYGEPADWALIARANSLTGGSQNQPIITFPKFRVAKSESYKLQIPARKTAKQPKVTTPVKTVTG